MGPSTLGPSTWTVPNYRALYACWQAGENSSWRGLEDCQRSIGKRPAPCLLVLYTVADVTLIAHSRRRNTPRLGARPRGDAGLRGRLARLIAAIGDFPAISVTVSDSRGRLPLAGKDPAEWYPRSATSRRRPANHPSSAHAPRTWLGPSITRRTGGTDREGGSRTGVRR